MDFIHYELIQPGKGTLTITDVAGHTMYTQNLQNSINCTVDIKKLPAGTHRLYIAQNETSASDAFIKK